MPPRTIWDNYAGKMGTSDLADLRSLISWHVETAGVGGTHPNLAGHDALGLATQAELDTHAGASDPHVAYALDADLANHEAATGGIHGIASTSALVLTSDARLTDARPPTTHGHTEADVANLAADLAGKAGTAHNHDANYAPTHPHPYAPTLHAHLDGDLPAGLARDAEVAATYSPIHAHPYEPSGAVATHAGLADPHPGYLTPAEGNAAYEASGAVTAHAQAGDPHPTYVTSAEGNAAYAALVHAHAPVHTVLANDTLPMALGVNTSVRLTVTANRTVTTTVPVAGSLRTVLILTASASSFTITFGSGFKPVGTLATGTTTARVFAVSFISDGTNLYETGRTAAMVA